MSRILALPTGPPSGASSAASEFGPALRIRHLRPALVSGSYKPTLLDVGLLGLTIVLGGQYFHWNAALAAGLVPAATAFFLISAAYVVLLFSLAEVASVFPFTGGGYAISRITLGFFGGFLVGAIDALQFIAYTSSSVLTLARLIVASVPNAAGLEPLVWVAFYVTAAMLQSRSHALFWRTNTLLAVSSLVILLVFCFGAMAKCDIRKYTVSVIDLASNQPVSQPSMTTMVRVLPFCAWFYVGADAIVLIADHVHEPRSVVPQAQRRAIVALVVTAIFTFFVTVALPEDMTTTAAALVPLTFGFTSFTRLSPAQAHWLSLPAIYATAFGFAWAYGRLVTALAASGLLPRWLAARIHQQVRRNQGLSSRAALGVGSLLSFLICVVVHYADRDPRELTHVCMGLAFLSYAAQTLGFLALRRGRSSGAALAKSPFRSPFGTVGAYLSLLVWLAGLVSVLGFQDTHNFVELSAISAVLLALALYYWLYARHHQLFSADERDVTLAASTAKRQPTAPIAPPKPPLVREKSKSRAPTVSDADGSFGARSSSGSLRMPQLVRTGSKLNNLLEEYPGLTDDMDEPYVAHWPPPQEQQSASPPPQQQPNAVPPADPLSISFSGSASSPSMTGPAPLRRAGSDSVLSSSVSSTPPVVAPTVSLLGGAFGRSFLVRHARLERLREETDRDLRSAMSGIWSERSQRWSRGRRGS